MSSSISREEAAQALLDLSNSGSSSERRNDVENQPQPIDTTKSSDSLNAEQDSHSPIPNEQDAASGSLSEASDDSRSRKISLHELKEKIKFLYKMFMAISNLIEKRIKPEGELLIKLQDLKLQQQTFCQAYINTESTRTESNATYSRPGPDVVTISQDQIEKFESNAKILYNGMMALLSIVVNDKDHNDNVGEPSDPELRDRRMPAQVANVDLVPIGSGYAMVPPRLLNTIDWSSHTDATRKLLGAIFPRSVLATHSLTGKPSPAFANRPPKDMLDPRLVDDIVKTVTAKCGVAMNVVRHCITIKCSDEAKLYRNRLKNQAARKSQHENDENIPPPD